MDSEPWFRRAQIAAAALLALVFSAAVAREMLVSPKAGFLSRRDAPWVVAPTPLQTDGIGIDLRDPPTAHFARPFDVAPSQGAVTLHVRALREVELFLNDRALPLEPVDASGWKRARSVDLRPWLAEGRNLIAARVRNPVGPPALQIWIEGLPERIETDAGWLAAWAGDPIALAVLAEDSFVHPEAAALPAPIPSLGRHAFAIAGCAAAGALLFLALRRVPPRAAARAPAAAALLLAAIWAALFANASAESAGVGFDAAAHLEYIRWFAAHRALPHPGAGTITYHPPLYHAAGALLLAVLRPTGLGEHAILLLIPMACGLGMAFVAGAMMRALVPGAPWLEAGALVAAGLLPMNLTIASNVSNEGPAAFFLSLALLIAVRALVARRAQLREDALLGAALGVSLLAKYSGLSWVPLLLGAVALKRLVVERTGAPRAALGVAVAGALVVALAGWVYVRNFLLTGDALVWNLSVDPARSWWQLPGFHTVDYFVRFGMSFRAPWFSSFYSFWDSLYSTLWGDGLLSGARGPASATPRWRYDFMAAGYLLAVPATLLLAGGWLRAARESLAGADFGRRLALSLVVVLPPIFLVTLLIALLRYPFWSGPKAFYALGLTPALAVFGVLGFAALDAALAARVAPALRAPLYGWAAAFLATVAWSYAG